MAACSQEPSKCLFPSLPKSPTFAGHLLGKLGTYYVRFPFIYCMRVVAFLSPRGPGKNALDFIFIHEHHHTQRGSLQGHTALWLLGLNCRPGSARALYHLPLVKGREAEYRKRCGVDGVNGGNTSQSSFCLVSGLTLKNRRQSLGSKKDAPRNRGKKQPGVSARV